MTQAPGGEMVVVGWAELVVDVFGAEVVVLEGLMVVGGKELVEDEDDMREVVAGRAVVVVFEYMDELVVFPGSRWTRRAIIHHTAFPFCTQLSAVVWPHSSPS